MSTCKKISVALERVWPQHCLLLMPEEWKISVDKEKVFGTFLANFQKRLTLLIIRTDNRNIECAWIRF